MRLAAVILALGGIALALVHMRLGEMSARHERLKLLVEEKKLQRAIEDDNLKLSSLTSPAEIRRRLATFEPPEEPAAPGPSGAAGTTAKPRARPHP